MKFGVLRVLIFIGEQDISCFSLLFYYINPYIMTQIFLKDVPPFYLDLPINRKTC